MARLFHTYLDIVTKTIDSTRTYVLNFKKLKKNICRPFIFVNYIIHNQKIIRSSLFVFILVHLV